jgi:hypothetical protein
VGPRDGLDLITLKYLIKSVRLRAGRADDRGSIPGGAGNFSLHYRVQTDSGAHTVSYPMGTGGFFPGGKAAGA